MAFSTDAPARGQRIRTATIVDVWNRECPHIEIGSSLTGVSIARIVGSHVNGNGGLI